MANTVKIGITAQDNGFKQSLTQMANAASTFAKEIGASGKGAQSLNGAMRTAKKAVFDLTLAYKQLSDEAKNSDFGKNLKEQLEQAKQAAAELIDMRGDISQQLKNMASDTSSWDSMKEGISVVGTAGTALIGVMSELGGESETAAQTLKLMATAQATLNAVITVGNALQKQSALMTGIQAIQAKAAAAATALQAKATTGATIAQKAFNIVANANPYVLLATAILAVGSALVGFATNMADAQKEEEKMKKEAEEAEEAEKRFSDNVASAGAELMVKLAALRKELDAVGESTEKRREICERYKDVIEATGMSVDDLSGAEVDYDKMFPIMNKSLVNRAIAMAKYQEAIELAKKQLQKLADAETRQATWNEQSTTKIYTPDEATKLGIQYFTPKYEEYETYNPEGTTNHTKRLIGYELSLKNKNKAIQDAKDEGKRIAENIQAEIEKKLNIGNEYLAAATGTTKKTTTNRKTTKPTKKTVGSKSTKEEQTQLEKLNKLYDTTAKKLENIKGDDETTKAARKNIYNDLVKINEQKLEFYDTDTPKGFDQVINILKDTLGLLDEESDKYKEIKQAIIDTNNARINDIMATGKTVENVKKVLPLLDDNLSYLEEGSEQWEATKKAAIAYKEAVSEMDSQHTVGTIGWLQDVISNKQELKLEISIDNLDGLLRATNEIKFLEDKQNVIDIYLELFNVDTFKQRYDRLLEEFKGNVEIIPIIKKDILSEAQNQINEQLEMYSNGLVDFDQLKEQYDKLIEYVSSKGIETSSITTAFKEAFSSSTITQMLSSFKNNISFDDLSRSLTTIKSNMESIGMTSREVFENMHEIGQQTFSDLQAQYDMGLIDADKFKSQVEELKEILEQLGIKIEFEPQVNMPKWQKAVEGCADAVSSIGDAFSSISQISDDEGLNAMGIIAQSIANIALGASKAIAQGSSLGPWGWLAFGAAAMAQMTAMIAQVHSATGMAGGGIVKGSTTMGDKIITRLNAGEMVLNRRQQSNLFNILDNGINQGSNVKVGGTVKVAGSDIYLSLKNYNKITGKTLQ